MDINKLINDAIKGYNDYLYCCDHIAQEAQKYIDWDSVYCDYFPGKGISILATIPDDCSTNRMPECVCPAKFFFAFVEGKESITPQEFKSISI